MKTIATALMTALALPACAAEPPAATPAQTIIFETGPCFGACPVYRVVLNSDGSGTFEGRRFTAVTGTRAFHATPRQYRAFAGQLEPIRPASGSVRYAGEDCAAMATDLSSSEVTWRSRGQEQHLYVYHGCDMARNRALIERLVSAPGLLPIGDYISARR